MEKTNKTWEGFEVICGYSRAQAIEDGVLVDVSTSKEAQELRFKFPIALSRTVWTKCVEVPNGTGQSIAGRLWDVLWMLRLAIRQNLGQIDQMRYKLHVRNDNRDATPPLVTLKAHCGPGDNGEPVITIMFPDED